MKKESFSLTLSLSQSPGRRMRWLAIFAFCRARGRAVRESCPFRDIIEAGRTACVGVIGRLCQRKQDWQEWQLHLLAARVYSAKGHSGPLAGSAGGLCSRRLVSKHLDSSPHHCNAWEKYLCQHWLWSLTVPLKRKVIHMNAISVTLFFTHTLAHKHTHKTKPDINCT